MSERVAIVTLAIGDRYLRRWQQVCEPGWRAYAERHGFDLHCLIEPLDDSERAQGRSPAWQKCLVLSDPRLAGYDRVVWIDADVVINPHAPSIVDPVPPGSVGAVDEYGIPDRETHRQLLRKLYGLWEARGVAYIDNPTPAEYYSLYGLPARHDAAVQTGVMVLSPGEHAEILERVYRDYEQRGGPEWNYEMRPLSFELLEGAPVHWLDSRFNYVWGVYAALHHPFLLNHPSHPRAHEAIAEAYAKTHLLHFAGGADALDLLAERGLPKPPGPVPAARQHPDREPAPVRSRQPGSDPRELSVALALYARPDTSARVLDAIREARPRRLLVFGDAPPDGDPELAARVRATRSLLEGIDWPCELETDLAAEHMGLRRRMESGLDWVFSRTEEAVILEDDCLPDPSFFRFCGELLERYRDEPRLMAISGNSFQPRLGRGSTSYRFSRYPLIWGWASWRRAWESHERSMEAWPELRRSGWLAEQFEGDRHAVDYWTHLFEQTRSGAIETWDYRFLLSVWRAGGLCAEPAANLVTNLGFRSDATHTASGRSAFANLPVEAIEFPLVHPRHLKRDPEGDQFTEDVVFSGNLRRLFEGLRKRRATREAVAR